MDTNKIESVKATIAKLITLANDNGAHEGEAATAMERATSLMAKYNLNQAEVMMKKMKAGEKLSAMREDADCYFTEKSYDWEYRLGWYIASIFECIAVKTFEYRLIKEKWEPVPKMSFVGMPEDVALILYFFDYCQDEIGRKTELYTKQKHKGNDFATGMVDRIWERLDELYKNVAKENASSEACTALIVVKKDAVSDAVKKEFPKTKKGKASNRKIDPSAYYKGREAGNHVILSSNRRQVK